MRTNSSVYLFLLVICIGRFKVFASSKEPISTTIQPGKVAPPDPAPLNCDITIPPGHVPGIQKSNPPYDLPSNQPIIATTDKSATTKRDEFLALRGKALANIATDLSEFYAQTTEIFSQFLTLIEDFVLAESYEKASSLNTELLAAKLNLMRTLQIILQSFIKDLSEISLTGITNDQHDDVEAAVKLLLENSRSIFKTIIETAESILSSVRESTVLDEPAKTRVASSILTLSNNKLQNLSNLLQQIANALQNKQNQTNGNRNAVGVVTSGIERLNLIELKIKNELLLFALQAEFNAMHADSGKDIVNFDEIEDEEAELMNWMNELQIWDSVVRD